MIFSILHFLSLLALLATAVYFREKVDIFTSLTRPYLIAVAVTAVLILWSFIGEFFVAHYSGAKFEIEANVALIIISLICLLLPLLSFIPSIGRNPSWVTTLTAIALCSSLYDIVSFLKER